MESESGQEPYIVSPAFGGCCLLDSNHQDQTNSTMANRNSPRNLARRLPMIYDVNSSALFLSDGTAVPECYLSLSFPSLPLYVTYPPIHLVPQPKIDIKTPHRNQMPERAIPENQPTPSPIPHPQTRVPLISITTLASLPFHLIPFFSLSRKPTKTIQHPAPPLLSLQKITNLHSMHLRTKNHKSSSSLAKFNI